MIWFLLLLVAVAGALLGLMAWGFAEPNPNTGKQVPSTGVDRDTAKWLGAHGRSQR